MAYVGRCDNGRDCPTGTRAKTRFRGRERFPVPLLGVATLRNRTLGPVAQLFIHLARELAARAVRTTLGRSGVLLCRLSQPAETRSTVNAPWSAQASGNFACPSLSRAAAFSVAAIR